ncbi:hypothetical protein J6W20_05275 [bacterium]|nr:hypothetical protein [bacterium]
MLALLAVEVVLLTLLQLTAALITAALTATTDKEPTTYFQFLFFFAMVTSPFIGEKFSLRSMYIIRIEMKFLIINFNLFTIK